MKNQIRNTLFLMCLVANTTFAQLQTEAGFTPGNRTMSASLEKNILFNATSRYTVTQSGAAAFTPTQMNALFDGAMEPQYTNVPINTSNPLVITIENLTPMHVQAGAWIGFSTRYWPTYKYKIEGYNSYNGANTWQTFTDINSSYEHQIAVTLPQGGFTKIRFTFYEGYPTSQPNGTMGISELFFIHPEAAQAYDGLLLKASTGGNVGIGTSSPNGKLEVKGNSAVYSDFATYTGTTSNYFLPNGKEPTLNISENTSGTLAWNVGGQITYRGGLSFGYGGPGIYSVNPNPAGSDKYGEIRFHTTDWNGSNLCNYDRMVIKVDGKVGIGTTKPTHLLSVNGTIRAKEVLVDLCENLADYVFSPDYSLMPLPKVEAFVKQNKHLPEIPSAAEVKEKGLSMGEMQNKLLQKIEELTLYVIEQQKQLEKQNSEISKQNVEIEKLKSLK